MALAAHSTDATGHGSSNSMAVNIEYTNYRGERGQRTIIPRRVYFGSNAWHPDPQWLLDGFDVEKGAERTFALKDIHGWRPAGLHVPQ